MAMDIHTRKTRKKKKIPSTPCAACDRELPANKTLRRDRGSGLFYCGPRCRDSLHDALLFLENPEEDPRETK